jgi:hypothetical protein
MLIIDGNVLCIEADAVQIINNFIAVFVATDARYEIGLAAELPYMVYKIKRRSTETFFAGVNII